MAQAGSKTVSPTVSVYLGDELAARVAEAKEAGTIDPKSVCRQALERALDGEVDRPLPELVTRNAELETVVGQWQEVWTEIVRILELPMVSVGQQAVDEVLGAIRQLKANPLMAIDSAELVSSPFLAFGRGPATDFKISWSDDEEQLVNRLQILEENGAWPVSVSVGPDGRILMLAAWPTE